MRYLVSVFLYLVSSTLLAHDWTGARPDSHAPIGVMGDHTHGSGEWMFSYRYMNMDMDGNRDGTERLNTSEVIGSGFMVSPIKMKMDMHMFGAMYAPNEHLTLMFMLPYIEIEMDHITGMAARFTTESKGIGDFKVSGLYKIFDHHGQRVHLNLGVSLPTGSIDEKDNTPMGYARLPYPMQLGSGTVDLLPGITYSSQQGRWSWGGQLGATIRIGENSNDYSLGNRINVTAWGARQLSDWWSVSLRLDHQKWDNIDGADPQLNPMVVPTADPDRRAGQRTDLGLGVNLQIRQGALKGQRLAIEYSRPVHQDLDGPQLETDAVLTVGWQYAIK